MNSAPYFYRSETHLADHHSVCFKVSCDPEKSWENGIYHNSRYGIFFLREESGKLKLELTSKGLNTNKFRKCTVKSEEHAINKILQWMADIIGESIFVGKVN